MCLLDGGANALDKFPLGFASTSDVLGRMKQAKIMMSRVQRLMNARRFFLSLSQASDQSEFPCSIFMMIGR